MGVHLPPMIRTAFSLSLLAVLSLHCSGPPPIKLITPSPDAEPKPKPTGRYNIRITIDPDRQILKGEADFQFEYPPNMPMGLPLAMDSRFDYAHTGSDGYWDGVKSRRDPEFHLNWEGWPDESRPDQTLLTHVTQDHLVLGPYFAWYPAPIDTGMVTTGRVTISCPDRFHIAADGIPVRVEEKYGFRKATYSYDGLNPRPLLCVVSRYEPATYMWKEANVRFLLSPVHRNRSDELFSSISEILESLEALFGPYPFPSLTIVEAPQVLNEDYALSQDILGMAFRGLILLPPGKLEGEIDRELIAHELAHQWWGGSVGRNHIPGNGGLWLTESMAQYATTRLGIPTSGDTPGSARLAEWARETRQIVTEFGDMALTELHPEKTDDAKILLAYNKGPYVLNMMSARIGAGKFDEFLKTFTHNWSGRRPTADDLERDLAEWSGEDWDKFFDVWIQGTGLPEISIRYSTEKESGGTWLLKVHCFQKKPLRFDLPVAVHTADGLVNLDLDLKSRDSIVENRLGTEPVSLVVNPNHELLLGEVEVIKVSPSEIRKSK